MALIGRGGCIGAGDPGGEVAMVAMRGRACAEQWRIPETHAESGVVNVREEVGSHDRGWDG